MEAVVCVPLIFWMTLLNFLFAFHAVRLVDFLSFCSIDSSVEVNLRLGFPFFFFAVASDPVTKQP